MTHSPLALAANLQFPPQTVGELIAYAKANPGKVSFGSAGVGTSHHLTGEKFKIDTGIDMQHVPYKGSGPAHIDLMGGQIQIMFDNIVALMPHFQGGASSGRSPSRAQSATRSFRRCRPFAEAGVRDFEAVAWFGFRRAGGHAARGDRAPQRRDREGARAPPKSASGCSTRARRWSATRPRRRIAT